jgi:hypothetical protein
VLTRLLFLLISKCTLRSESDSVALGTRNYLFCVSYVYCHTLRWVPYEYKPAGFIERHPLEQGGPIVKDNSFQGA